MNKESEGARGRRTFQIHWYVKHMFQDVYYTVPLFIEDLGGSLVGQWWNKLWSNHIKVCFETIKRNGLESHENDTRLVAWKALCRKVFCLGVCLHTCIRTCRRCEFREGDSVWKRQHGQSPGDVTCCLGNHECHKEDEASEGSRKFLGAEKWVWLE